jgi:hypothetical protein
VVYATGHNNLYNHCRANWQDLKEIEIHIKLSTQNVRERMKIGDDPKKADLWTDVLRYKRDKSMFLVEIKINATFLVSPITDI